MMKVTAVNNGVVIDHITAGKCMKLYQFLDLDHVDATIALIKNAPSQKMGKKDIIKIDTELELDLDALGYIDPNVTINIVKDGVCVKKGTSAAARTADEYHPVQKPSLHHLCGAGDSPYLQADRQGKGRISLHLLRIQGKKLT